jgi:hypothetical protein
VRGLEVVTLNGFPYKGFQRPVVKHAVYWPDWTGDERLDHTVRLAQVLAGLLPDDAARGSVSTVPLAWREPWDAGREAEAGTRLRRLGEALDDLRESTGRTVRVAFEPEPGCVVETTQDAVDRLGGAVRHPSIGVCVDACHLAVAFEDPAEAVRLLTDGGLSVVKLQASAALHVDCPGTAAARQVLSGFAEDRFLHQVRRQPSVGARATGWDDLDEAVASGDDGSPAWRVHFHVPLGREPEPPLASTAPHLRETLRVLLGGEQALTDHVDAETYTWGVLPRQERPADDVELARSIAGELAWLRAELLDLGLKEA